MAAVATQPEPSPRPAAELSQHQLSTPHESLHTLLTAAKQLSNMPPTCLPDRNACAVLEKTSTEHRTSPRLSSSLPSTALRKPCYKTTTVLLTPLDLTTVRLPMYYPRDMNRHHVNQLKWSLLQEGVEDEGGFITFCANFGQKQVVRGAQLLLAFCELYEQGRIRYLPRDETMSLAEHQSKLGTTDGILHVDKMKCALLERIDEKDKNSIVDTPFTATETLLLAAQYNSKHAHVRPMSVVDNITLAQRFILCRLRDLNLSEHLESLNRRPTPPNIVWSKLGQFVNEATMFNLIPYSTTPSAPAPPGVPGDCSNAEGSAVWRQQTRAKRQRQAEYIRLALSLLWSPHTNSLIMNRYKNGDKPISCSLWSIRTFRLTPFTSADDPVQFVMLLALYRCQNERRGLRLRPFDRDKTKRFLELIVKCVEKLLAFAMKRTRPPFPTKWDIFNAVTTINAAPPTIQPAPTHQQQKRVTMADILMSLLTRWEENGAGGDASPPNPNACTRENILFSLQCFMQRWPFSRKWRVLSPSVVCFEPTLFLQPLLPLESIRFWPSPTLTLVPASLMHSFAQNGAADIRMRCDSGSGAMKQVVHCRPRRPAAIAPHPIRMARLLATVDDRTAPLAEEITSSALKRNASARDLENAAIFPAALQSNLTAVLASPSDSQSVAVRVTSNSAPSAIEHTASNNDSLPQKILPGAAPEGSVDEEMLDEGEGGAIVDRTEDYEECIDSEVIARNSDCNSSSIDTQPANQPENDVCDASAALSSERTTSIQHLKRTRSLAPAKRVLDKSKRRRKQGKNVKRSSRPSTADSRRPERDESEMDNEVVCEQEYQDDDDDNDSDEELDPFYDKITAVLPPATGVNNLPTACHDLGAWKHYLQNEDLEQLSALVKRRCAAVYYSEQHKAESTDSGTWPAIVGHRAYCCLRNSELHTNGYTILRGMLENTVVGSDADCVIKHFAEMWTGEKKYTQRQQQKSAWQYIFNCGGQHDSEHASKGIGRYTVSVRELVDRTMEQYPEIFKKRLRVEATIGILIDDVVQDTNDQTPLKFPVTGSRLLFQTRHAEPQLPHYDFGHVKYRQGNTTWRPECRDLSYFAMISGAEGFHLRIWREGHRMLYGPFHLVSQIASTIQSEMIFIPPYSVLIVRGDLPHAGVGGEEADGPQNASGVDERMHIRFHIYVARHFERLKDGVYVARHKLKINDTN